MTTASATARRPTAAQHRAAMQHIGATIMPAALSCALAAPLIGITLIWGSTFVALLCQVISTGGAGLGPTLELIWNGVAAAYLATALPAAMSGVWLALLSPFAPENPRFYAGAAAIGMVCGFLFASTGGTSGLFGGQLFLGVVGAVTVFICAWLTQDVVLKRDEVRRDKLARSRAQRLATERASAADKV